MNTIFVVTSNIFSYEDNSSYPILVTSNRAIADAKVKEMEQRLARVLLMRRSVHATMTTWEQTNPRVRPGSYVEEAMPIFKGKKKEWTKIQQDECDRVKKKNQDAYILAFSIPNKWIHERFEEMKKIIATFTEEEQKDYTDINDENSWSVEEVSYVE